MAGNARKPAEKPALDLTPLSNPALPGNLSADIATHLPKISHIKTPADQFVRAMQTVSRDTGATYGLCSATIDSVYSLSSISSGGEVSRGMALATDLAQDQPASVLGGLVAGQNVAMLPGESWRPLQDSFAALRDYYPSRVTQYERLVFFEGSSEQGEVLLTPIASVKLIHEMNRRLQERQAARKQAKDQAARSTTGEAVFVPRRIDQIDLPVGGANSQNVGAVVNKNARNTRKGSVPTLAVRCPEDLRSEQQRMISVLLATGQYEYVAPFDPDALRHYGRRAVAPVDFSRVRVAEQRQAVDIATHFLSLQPVISEFLQTMSPERVADIRIDPDEAAWLDPRQGRARPDLLAARFARRVKLRIERLMRKKSSGQDPAFILPDRSLEALIRAFRECL